MSSHLNDHHFQTRRGGLDKSDFYFIQIYFKKSESSQILIICDDYIKNNSYINLGDWIHIRIVWSCSSNAVKTHNVNIFLKKLTSSFLLEAKTLIKYNSYNLGKMKMKETIDIEFTQQIDAPEMIKMLLTLDDLVY